MIRAELGRHSLIEKIATRNLNYLNYIHKKDEDELIKMAAGYENLILGRENLFSIRKQYASADTNTIFAILSKDKNKKYIREDFDMKWKEYIKSYPKAFTYSTFKDKINMENYLTNISSRKHRVAFTKLRLSDHNLMIEKGRHVRPSIPREERYCPICRDKVESECHFLLECTLYNRQYLCDFSNLVAPNFANLELDEKFLYLMTQENIALTKMIAQAVKSWMEIRTNFIELCEVLTNIMALP